MIKSNTLTSSSTPIEVVVSPSSGWTDIVQVGSALAAFVTIAIAVYIYKRQTNIQAFLEYTGRYAEIRSKLHGIMTSWREGSDLTEDQLSVFIGYFNICSEEYYLYKSNMLSKKIWSIWEKEIVRMARLGAVQAAWELTRSEYETYGGFCAWMDSITDAPSQSKKNPTG